MLETPVLFLVFNRPYTTARVLDRIIDARPRVVFVAADGPRAGNNEDEKRCSEVRALVDRIPPDIEVRRLFRQENLGCRKSVSSALEWFFSQVDRGIVLEDDCLPDPSFFGFCEAALLRYEHEERVMLVSGHNPLGAFPSGKDALLSKYPFIWGWASWRRAWKHYKPEIGKWASKGLSTQIKSWLRSPHALSYWRKAFKDVENGADTWDFQLDFAMFVRRTFAIVPAKNLVSNIGFGKDARHTTDPEDNRKSLPVFVAPSAPQFPVRIVPNPYFERRIVSEFYFNRDLTILGKAKMRLRQMFAAFHPHAAFMGRGRQN
jgi:hypothetical protein